MCARASLVGKCQVGVEICAEHDEKKIAPIPDYYHKPYRPPKPNKQRNMVHPQPLGKSAYGKTNESKNAKKESTTHTKREPLQKKHGKFNENDELQVKKKKKQQLNIWPAKKNISNIEFLPLVVCRSVFWPLCRVWILLVDFGDERLEHKI